MRVNKYVWLLTLTLWLCSLAFLYVKGSSAIEKELAESISKNEIAINQLLDIAIAYNLSIKNQMDANLRLIDSIPISHPLLAELKDFPDINAYGLEGNETIGDKAYKANLTGIGPLEAVDINTQQEIGAALSLSLSSPLKEDKHDFIWSYYTSKKGFMLLSPRVDINTFHFKPAIYQKPFWQVAIPANNPEKKTAISNLYLDAAGQGLMISISTPVYSGPLFRGVVSLDVGINYLEQVLDSGAIELDDKLLLITINGDIASSGQHQDISQLAAIDFNSYPITPYQLSVLGGDEVIFVSKPIHNKFYVAYNLSLWELNSLILNNLLSKIIILLLIFIVSGLIVYLFATLLKTKRLAQIDGLSQVYNRQTLEEISNREFLNTKRQKGKISVIMIDIDNFKKLNDSFGHKAGDRGIKHVANIVTNTIRETDVFGRYGGEEFLVTLPNSSLEDAAIVAEKLRSSIEESTFSKNLKLTISLGCAEFDCSHNPINFQDFNFQDLCSNADKALYQAKAQGRNRVVRYTRPADKK